MDDGRIRVHRRRHEQAASVPQNDLDLDDRGGLMQRCVHLVGHLDRHERRATLGRELAVPILSSPDGQKRTADAVPPRGCRDLTMSLMTFLDHPDLVRVAPVPPPRRVLGGQDLDLGCERKVGHNVGLIIASSAPSDGPRRRVTWKFAACCIQLIEEQLQSGRFEAVLRVDGKNIPAWECRIFRQNGLKRPGSQMVGDIKRSAG